MSRALRDLLRAETDRLRDAGLYKREVVFSRSGGMAAGGMMDGREGQSVINYPTHDYLGLSADPQVLRRIAPRGFLVGVSCHSAAEVLAAERDDAECAVFGPVCYTASRTRYGAPGGLAR